MTSVSFPISMSSPDAEPVGWLDRRARAILFGRLSTLSGGTIRIVDADGVHDVGADATEPTGSIRVNRPNFYRRAITGGNLGVAASYLDGDWDCDDLTLLFRLMVRQINTADRVNGGMSRLGGLAARCYHSLRSNTIRGSRRNIQDHYDLGNDFFELFLDETMSYSCGYYATPETTLHEASIAKIDRLCQKLELKRDDHLIEIGTGWGGFAIHAATNYGCRVTTTTLSIEQKKMAEERIKAAGLDSQVTVLLEDYRNLTGRYDKLVSVEMVEAVGHRYLPTYFGKCASLLNPDGRMAIQAITMPDHRYERFRRSTDFIQRYVFPGSCVPSVTAMSNAIAAKSDLRIAHLEEIGTHYAQTLRDWQSRFFENIEAIHSLGYPDRLARLWNYYLTYCEAGFEERYTGLVQMVLVNPNCRTRLPIQVGNTNHEVKA